VNEQVHRCNSLETNQNIKVFIAGRPYNISVARDEEEVVRKAAELLNRTIKDYSNSYEYKDQQDLFAMVALQHVANSIRIQELKSFKEEEMKNKLLQIDAMLAETLA
jgi:cell division protein ZapA